MNNASSERKAEAAPTRLADLAKRLFTELQEEGVSIPEVRRIGLLLICVTTSTTTPEENSDGNHRPQLR